MKKLLFITLLGLLSLLSNQAASASCNWNARINWNRFSVTDDCTDTASAYLFIRGHVSVDVPEHVTYSWKLNGSLYVGTDSQMLHLPEKNGTYTICLTLTDVQLQCDTTICRTVTINCITACNWRSQHINLIADDTCGVNGDSATITTIVSFNGHYNYKYGFSWELTPDTASGTRYLSPTMNHFVVHRNGVYNLCVTVTDSLNACDTTLCRTFDIQCIQHHTGIQPPDTRSRVLVLYPNPARESIRFGWTEGEGVYELSDVTGRILLSGKVGPGQNVIPAGNLPAGVYWVTVTGNSGRMTGKVILGH